MLRFDNHIVNSFTTCPSGVTHAIAVTQQPIQNLHYIAYTCLRNELPRYRNFLKKF